MTFRVGKDNSDGKFILIGNLNRLVFLSVKGNFRKLQKNCYKSKNIIIPKFIQNSFLNSMSKVVIIMHNLVQELKGRRTNLFFNVA